MSFIFGYAKNMFASKKNSTENIEKTVTVNEVFNKNSQIIDNLDHSSKKHSINKSVNYDEKTIIKFWDLLDDDIIDYEDLKK